MKIDVGIISSGISKYGGAEIFLLQCLKRWQNQIKITLYTPHLSKKLLGEFGVDPTKIRIFRLPNYTGKKRFKLFDSIVLQTKLWDSLIENHDIYLQNTAPLQFISRKPSIWLPHEPLRMLYDLRFSFMNNVESGPFHIYPKSEYESIYTDDLDINYNLLEIYDKNFNSDYIIANSKIMSCYYETIYSKKADIIIYPGIDVGETLPKPSPLKKAIFVGNLWRHKRIDILIHAFSYIPEGELIIVGDGPERKKLEELTRHFDLSDRIHFTGKVSTKEKAKLFSQASCGVYTPFFEPFGIMPMEAAAAGLPLVVSESGGYCECLDSDCAFILPPSPKIIANSINKLFNNYDLVLQMGKAAWEKVRLHTWDNTALQILDFIKEVHRKRKKNISASFLPQIGAFYYPWYQSGEKRRHWNENSEYSALKDFPIGGPYTSTDPAILSNHIKLAVEAGLDFLVINWEVSFEGLHPMDLEATRKLFDSVEKSSCSLKLAIMIRFKTESFILVKRYMEVLRNEFIIRPSYLKKGKQFPVWYFLNNAFIGTFYRAYKKFESLNQNIIPIAVGSIVYKPSVPKHIRKFFKGWQFYSPLQICSPNDWYSYWMNNYYVFCEHSSPDSIRTFTICPGYDDTQLTNYKRKDELFRKIPRGGLKTYDIMQAAALDLNPIPDLVVITSFNEFHENTHLEPSTAYGDMYIKATKIFKDKLIASANKLGI